MQESCKMCTNGNLSGFLIRDFVCFSGNRKDKSLTKIIKFTVFHFVQMQKLSNEGFRHLE